MLRTYKYRTAAMETEEPWSYHFPYDIDMAQFLRDGFVILREA